MLPDQVGTNHDDNGILILNAYLELYRAPWNFGWNMQRFEKIVTVSLLCMHVNNIN